MAEIVLVHGTGQERYEPGSLEAALVAALTDGLRAAGYDDDLAGRARLANYSGLFAARAQEELDREEEQVVAGLLGQVLAGAAERGAEEAQRQVAGQAVAVVDQALASPDGPLSVLRPLVDAAWTMGDPAQLGLTGAKEFFWGDLAQVARYLLDNRIREAATTEVAELVGPETKAVVAHSLGAVVAYEALHRQPHPVPLLITLGAPLGFRGVVYDRLRPQPARVPPGLRRWLNVLDRRDLVAASVELAPRFPGDAGVVEPNQYVDNGSEPHSAKGYLAQVATGRPVGEALRAE
ncbi:pimeloyl-ACP methyl ester carboxylesterase [Crossiella equi]|uniref:Pimeloyl-ACP methyl ester carboxylesterase n=1 Tax=Crossiella equi TaxID=130796 RepID=A0ABS5AH31_9PSEU|nr:hypothetical protein [Crossiella equi]MBP2475888.1 pimeloyl-ACP methyl ester carboxylesterase [Crossiella equi]